MQRRGSGTGRGNCQRAAEVPSYQKKWEAAPAGVERHAVRGALQHAGEKIAGGTSLRCPHRIGGQIPGATGCRRHHFDVFQFWRSRAARTEFSSRQKPDQRRVVTRHDAGDRRWRSSTREFAGQLHRGCGTN